jgi:hypothetical protein
MPPSSGRSSYAASAIRLPPIAHLRRSTGSLLGREVSSGFDRLADLAVQCLDRVGGVDDAAYVGREGEEGDHVLPGLAPGGADHRVALAPVGLERFERFAGRVGVDGGVDRAQVVCDLLAVLVGDEAQRLAS